MIFSYDSITSFMDKILWILYDPVSPVETGSKSVDGSHESPYLLQWNQGTSPWNSHHIPMKFPWNSHMKFAKKFWCEGTTGSQSYWFKVRSLRYRAHRVGLALDAENSKDSQRPGWNSSICFINSGSTLVRYFSAWIVCYDKQILTS